MTLLAGSTSEGALNALDLRVTGVFSTGIPEMDKRLVYTDVATAQELVASPRVSSIGIYLRALDLTEAAQLRIGRLFSDRYAVKTWREQAFFYLAVRSLYNRIFGALGAIIAVIVIFVTANAMAMAIIERTREIGTLRALGTLPGQLIRYSPRARGRNPGRRRRARRSPHRAQHFACPAVRRPRNAAAAGALHGLSAADRDLARALHDHDGRDHHPVDALLAAIASRTASKPIVEALGHV